MQIYQLKATGATKLSGSRTVVRSSRVYFTRELALKSAEAFMELATGPGRYDLDRKSAVMEVSVLELIEPEEKKTDVASF